MRGRWCARSSDCGSECGGGVSVQAEVQDRRGRGESAPGSVAWRRSSMLSQSSVYAWEGRLVAREDADARGACCSRLWEVRLRTRTRVKAGSGRLICPQGTGTGTAPRQERSREALVRVSDGGASPSGLDVRIAPGDGEARRDEFVWPDSFSSLGYAHTADPYLNCAVEESTCVAESRIPPQEEAVNANSRAEEAVYYEPKVGDYVIGTVASGSFSKLEIDIGAEKLAHLFRKDVTPPNMCNVREMSWESPASGARVHVPAHGPWYVHDEEVLCPALEAPIPVERGTVFTLEVKGVTPAGIAVVSTRSVARGYAWQRIRQLQEQDVILEVQITEWTSAGLVCQIEGLRAFLPIYNLVSRPPESSPSGTVSCKEYVGQFFSVMIHSVDETKNNLVLSEKKAWVARKAYLGALVDGIVTDVQPYGVHLQIKDTDLSGVLHISNISRARIDDIGSLFRIGEEVRAMVVPSNLKRRISFCTADLEDEDGLMLRDKAAVYQGADSQAAELARAYKIRNSESTIDSDDYDDSEEQDIVIANWDWLDFGDKTDSDL